MADQAIIMGLALCAAGVGGSALCSGLETGFYTVSRLRLRVRAGKGDRRAAMVQRELREPDRVLTTLLVWNNVFNYLGSLGLTTILLSLGFSDSGVILLQALVLTPLLLIFAESLPKELFRVRANEWPVRLVGLVRVMRWLILPVQVGLLWLGRRVSRLTGGSGRLAGDRRHRVASLLKEGVVHGTISPVQASLIDDALLLVRKTVGEMGTPIARMSCVPAGEDEERLRAAARRAGNEPVVLLRRGGRVAALLDPLDIGTGRVMPAEPLRIDVGVGARDALARLVEHGVEAAVVTRGGRDVGVVTTRRIVRPLLRSLRPETIAGGNRGERGRVMAG